jgi:hypothetical protein
MNVFFISPVLIDYKYLEDLCLEAANILNVDLNQGTNKKELKISLFLNFNRYLTIQIGLMPENIKNGFYEDLADLMEDHSEEKTIKLLTDLEILPESRNEFIKILKNLK